MCDIIDHTIAVLLLPCLDSSLVDRHRMSCTHDPIVSCFKEEHASSCYSIIHPNNVQKTIFVFDPERMMSNGINVSPNRTNALTMRCRVDVNEE